jgi:hypothetical protein
LVKIGGGGARERLRARGKARPGDGARSTRGCEHGESEAWGRHSLERKVRAGPTIPRGGRGCGLEPGDRGARARQKSVASIRLDSHCGEDDVVRGPQVGRGVHERQATGRVSGEDDVGRRLQVGGGELERV